MKTLNSIFELRKTTYIPSFYTNVASLDLLLEAGYNWNLATRKVTKSRSYLFLTTRIYKQLVIKYNEISAIISSQNLAANTTTIIAKETANILTTSS